MKVNEIKNLSEYLRELIENRPLVKCYAVVVVDSMGDIHFTYDYDGSIEMLGAMAILNNKVNEGVFEDGLEQVKDDGEADDEEEKESF